MTVQYRTPVRANTPQVLGPYTFKDQFGAIIDLTPYIQVYVEGKVQGSNFQYLPVVATIVSPPTAGIVQASQKYSFPTSGVWDVQFVCIDLNGNKLYGEPVQFKVVPNVEDLGLTQLPAY